MESAWLSWQHARLRTQRSEVRITAPTYVSLERCLFKLMTDKKYQIIHMFHVGSVLQITLIHIKVFKVCLHIISFKRPKTTSKLDQLVTVQCVAINTPGQRFTTQHASTMNHGPTVICYYSVERLLHYMDTSRTSICEDKLRADLTFHS